MKREKKQKSNPKRFKENLIAEPQPNDNKLEENVNGNLDPAFENNDLEKNNNENILERNDSLNEEHQHLGLNNLPPNEGENMDVDNLSGEEEPGNEEEINYDEYYPVNRYAVDVNNNDRYAKKRTLDEFYLMEDQTEKYAVKRLPNGDTVPFYARTKRDEPIFAKDNGQPVYPKTNYSSLVFPTVSSDSKQQIYLKLDNGREIYPENDQLTEMYASDENGNEYMARDESNSFYYATMMDKMKEKIEYLPKDSEGNITPIILPDGKYKYPMNKIKGYPVYETKKGGDQVYFTDPDRNEYYGKNSFGKEVYAETKQKDRQILAKLNNDEPFYAKLDNGKEYYPVDQLLGQYYLRKGNIEIPAVDEKGLHYYAKSIGGDECYPRIYEED